jgi:hypothetical protein
MKKYNGAELMGITMAAILFAAWLGYGLYLTMGTP